jgi:two-component system KDP operon response regulator KdpE
MDPPHPVCLLEDDPAIGRMIARILRVEDIEVIVCNSLEKLLESVRGRNAGLTIADAGIQPESARALIDQIKATSAYPVLATSTAEEVQRAAVEAGADDFQAKPFDPDVFLDRVRFLLGRPLPAPQEDAIYGNPDIRLDLGQRVLSVHGALAPVSRTEWDILRALVSHAGEPVFHADITRAAFGRLHPDGDYLGIWISRLQSKLKDNPSDPKVLRPFHQVAWTLELGRVQVTQPRHLDRYSP